MNLNEQNYPRNINVLALIRGEERYVFLYTDENKLECLRTLGRFASNPELSFNWYDSAVLSQKIRQNNDKKIKINLEESFKSLEEYLNDD